MQEICSKFLQKHVFLSLHPNAGQNIQQIFVLFVSNSGKTSYFYGLNFSSIPLQQYFKILKSEFFEVNPI